MLAIEGQFGVETNSNPPQTLIVTAKNVYGRMLYYPENETAALFAELVGQKCLQKHHLDLASRLQFRVDVRAPLFE